MRPDSGIAYRPAESDREREKCTAAQQLRASCECTQASACERSQLIIKRPSPLVYSLAAMRFDNVQFREGMAGGWTHVTAEVMYHTDLVVVRWSLVHPGQKKQDLLLTREKACLYLSGKLFLHT